MTVGTETCNTLAVERRLKCPDLECDIIIYDKVCSGSSGLLIRMYDD